MKISKYENSMFPYSLHSTVNLSAWRLRDTSVTLMSFSVYPLIQLLPKEKGFFSKSRDKYFQNQRNPCRIVNFPFCDVITKIRTCIFVTSCESIRHKKLHDKDQKIYTNSFCFYVLNELMPEFFHNSYEILMKIMQNK